MEEAEATTGHIVINVGAEGVFDWLAGTVVETAGSWPFATHVYPDSDGHV